jgi:hypothetical protein
MIGSLLLLILAPVDCKTKRIPKEKRGYYKKRLFLLLVVFGIILSFYLYKNQHNFFSLLTLCIIIIVINEIIGILINQQSK